MRVLFAFASVLFAASLAARSTLIEQGRVALDRSDPQSAVKALQDAVAQSPRDAEAHYLLGIAYGKLAEKSNMFRRAALARHTRAEFEHAVELDPNHLDARFGLVQYYMIAPEAFGGSEQKALEQASEIAKRNSAAGHRAFAFIDGRHKNYKAEEAELDAAVKLDPNDMPTWFEIGHVAALTGDDLPRGEQALQKYLKYTPARDEPPLESAYSWLANIYEREGRAADAAQANAKAQKLRSLSGGR